MNKQRKRVLVHVDLRRRDLMHSVWLKHWLEQLGAEVRLCSRVTLLREFERFRPHAAILSHTNEFGLDHNLLVERAKRSRLFVLPTEDATDDRDMYYESHEPDVRLAQAQPEKGWLHYFTHVYCWGPINKQRLLEARLMREAQSVVSGNPRFDLDWERLFSEPTAGKPIGIIGNFVDINQWDVNVRPWPLMLGETKHPPYLFRRTMDGPQCFFEAISDLRAGAGHIYPVDRNAEDMLWGSIAHFRLILDFLDRWTALGGRVILRPHTMERKQSYDVLVRRYRPHLEINDDPGFFLFLQKVSAVLVMSTTSIIEALLARRPIVCFELLLKGRYLEHVEQTPWKRLPYLEHLWRPQSMEELIAMTQAATRGELAVCPDMSPFAEKLRVDYDWPRDEPSTLTIARDVMSVLERDGFEPPTVSPLCQLRNEADYRSYMFARRARQIAQQEHRYLDNLTHYLGMSRREEQEIVSFMRRT